MAGCHHNSMKCLPRGCQLCISSCMYGKKTMALCKISIANLNTRPGLQAET
uniref:Uncharacterized protein n=1 Tax=Anguilla anguilla TaxID=7936 RepID=A0A0E9SCQ2_ANGAN